MLVHSICGIVQHQRHKRVKFIGRGKSVTALRVSEHGDALELALVTAHEEMVKKETNKIKYHC